MKKCIVLLSLIMVMSTFLVGCGKEETSESNGVSVKESETQESKSGGNKTKEKEDVVLRFYSNVADRTSGVGMLEELLAERYMSENPGVKIQFECLDGESFKQKFTAYLTSNDVPDIFMSWGLPSWIDPIIENGYAAELTLSDYDAYGFVPGSLDGFMKDGKLYGLPKVMDFMVMYYNQEIYDKCGLDVPESFEDIYASIPTLIENGYEGISMDAKDGWPLGIYYQDLFVKLAGDQKVMYDVLNKEVSIYDVPEFLEAAKELQRMGSSKVFQESYLTSDYGAAINLFGQEKAAMFYMGSWATTIAVDESYSESFRSNAKVMNVPVFESGKGNKDNILAWFGGGYQVSNNSEHKEEAIDVLNFFMQPDNWAKEAWQNGVALPVQNVESFLTGNETQMQLDLIDMIKNIEDSSGVVWIDYLTPAFKTDVMTATQEVAASIITPEEFVDKINQAIQDVK